MKKATKTTKTTKTVTKSTFVNPYRSKSIYRAILSALRSGGKSGLTMESMLKRFPVAAIGVVISPKSVEACKGDCRGNFSAQGHIYYVERKVDAKGTKRYIPHMRETEMPKSKRTPQVKVDSKKISTKAKTTVTATATVKAGVKSVEAVKA